MQPLRNTLPYAALFAGAALVVAVLAGLVG